MNSILLFSHGSVLCGAEQNLLQIAARLRARTGVPVEVAFLNYSAPGFDEAVDRLAASGVKVIDIAPYFLIAGKFVVDDLPGRIAAARERHRSIEFRVARPLGFHVTLADGILSCAARAAETTAWRDTEQQAAQFCRDSPKCPLHGTPSCPATSAERPPRSVPAGSRRSSPDADSLLVLAHGSPRAEANDDIREVVERLRQRSSYANIHLGFLDVNQPDIPTAVAEMVARGAQNIVAVPYFLHTGKHVTRDVPDLLDAATARHGVRIVMGDYLGHDEAIDDVLLARLAEL